MSNMNETRGQTSARLGGKFGDGYDYDSTTTPRRMAV